MIYLSLVALWCVGIPVVAIQLGQAYPNTYDATFSKTLTLTLSLHPGSGVSIVTSQTARIPAATPTTPPTYGTVSVSAVSSVSGAAGNIPASDINQACCSPSILAQNLYAFSGGQDAKDVPVLSKADLSTGTQALTAQVNAAVSGQAPSLRRRKPARRWCILRKLLYGEDEPNVRLYQERAARPEPP
jgi:hypothetical protein